MADQSYSDLKARANVIKNETTDAANTATRVGSLLFDQVDSFQARIADTTALITQLETNIKGGVGTDGDTLKKLRDLISSLGSGQTTLSNQINTINNLLLSNDINLDTLQEIVDFIKGNEADINSLLSGKLDKSAKANEAEGNSQTDDTKYITSLRLGTWLASVLARALSWTGNWQFAGTFKFSSLTASKWLKLNSSGEVTSTDIAISDVASLQASLDNKQNTLTDQIFGTFSNGLTAKTTPVDADTINISDSTDTNKSKKVTWANVKATLSSFFIKFTTNASLAGLGNIVAVFDSTGTLQTTYSTASEVLSDSIAITRLTTESNWSTANVYTGTALDSGTVGVELGQYYDSGNYRYFVTGGFSAIRISLNSILHIIGNSSAPTIAAGAGAGTSPSVSIGGSNDIAGRINVTTGTLPTASATVVTITFNRPYGSAPYVVLFPANANTAMLSGATMVFVTSTTTTFVITSGATGLTASTAYQWNYQVAQ